MSASYLTGVNEMKHCDKCNIDVESNLNNCPLCGAYLKADEGIRTENRHAYPDVKYRARSRRIFFKLFVFASIIAGLVCLVVDYAVNKKITWSLHLVVALLGYWVTLGRSMFFRLPLRRQLVADFVVAVLIVFYAEHFAGSTNHWAFHLGMPIAFMAVFGAFLVMCVLDNRHWRLYAMSVTPICVISVIPIIVSIIVFKDINWAWYIATGMGISTIISFVLFGKQGYVTELKKRLHF